MIKKIGIKIANLPFVTRLNAFGQIYLYSYSLIPLHHLYLVCLIYRTSQKFGHTFSFNGDPHESQFHHSV